MVEQAQAHSEALVRGEVAALNRILAGEFVWTNATGQVEDRRRIYTSA